MASFKGDGKAILLAFIMTIIATVILAAVANSSNLYTTTQSRTNLTVTAPAVNATTDLEGRSLVGSGTVVNATSGATVAGGILQTAEGTNGLQSVQITLNDTAAAYAGQSVNVTYTFEPDGYVNGSAARAILTLVILFGALGILLYVLVQFYKDGTLGKLIDGKRLG